MPPIADEHIPHEAETVEAMKAEARRTSSHAAIDDVDSALPSSLASASAAYDEAEADLSVAAVNALLAAVAELQTSQNEVLDVLRDAELIPTEEV